MPAAYYAPTSRYNSISEETQQSFVIDIKNIESNEI